MKVWTNGNLVDAAEAKVSVFDHGLLYGDGVFEGIRVYGRCIFECQAHVDRLYDSARRIRLAIPYTKQELIDAMAETVSANGVENGYIRLVVTRGPGTLGLHPFKCADPVTFIIADQIALYPAEMYRDGMAVIVAKTVRVGDRQIPSAAKTLNYLNNILAKIEAVDAGVAEAIMLNQDGNVSECTGDNLFVVDGGGLITPPLDASILPGITRKVVLQLARDLDIPVEESTLSVEQLYGADECFLTGTAAEVIAVTKVDGTIIGDGKPGPITRTMLEAFRGYITATCG